LVAEHRGRDGGGSVWAGWLLVTGARAGWLQLVTAQIAGWLQLVAGARLVHIEHRISMYVRVHAVASGVRIVCN